MQAALLLAMVTAIVLTSSSDATYNPQVCPPRKCRPGQRCIVRTIPCLIPPCPVQYVCIPSGNQNRCLLPPVGGPCYGYFLRYYYDAGSRQCRRFVYGGCQGNANRFQTREECLRACRGQHPY